MATDGINRTNQFDTVVNDALSKGEFIGDAFQRMKEALHAAAASAPPAGDTALPASHQFKFERELKFSPTSGRRDLVLRADSEADLQRLENNILYGHD